MAEKVIMPKLGMTMKQGKVTKWHYKEGDRVEAGDVIAEIETDKINYEIEAPISGILARVLVREEGVAAVGEAIGIMVEEGETFDESAIPASTPEGHGDKEGVVTTVEKPVDTPVEVTSAVRIKITPVARKIAKEKGIDISKIRSTRPDGRIRKEDVLAAAEAAEKKVVSDKEPAGEGEIQLGATVPLTRMREIIGQRLTASSRDVPHVYFACEVDGTQMIQLRKTVINTIESTTGVRLSFSDIIIRAVATTIEKYPLFNAVIEDREIKIQKEINIGLAMALEEGLIVPVIRNVNKKTLGQIATDRNELMQKARTKKLTLDDLEGGTFTVSNLGQFNIDFFTSIINPPETGILSVAKIKDRPVVFEGEVAIRPILYLGLSADHRVVDGAMAAAFIQDLQQALENPYRMCLV
ncbi:MAG: 2-oxo acid dehydrogenase subunit E2 [Desulfobacteraceae bacterium]|nr:2-oxo acid dehydrogenase subunit E2 [Desulfobacteraceae bacterium]